MLERCVKKLVNSSFYINKEEALFVIVDIQEKLAPSVKNNIQVVKNTNILLQTANRLKIPVVVTQQYTEGLGETLEDITKNLWQTNIYEKTAFSGYTKEVAEDIKKIDRKKIIIAGMETHVCVYQTVRDLLQGNYEVFVLSDAVSSRREENYFNGLALMRQMGAVISNTESIFFDLIKDAARPEFKELLPLIK